MHPEGNRTVHRSPVSNTFTTNWNIYVCQKRQISYLGGRLILHISTFLLVTLAVLAARHLSFAALALLVDAATLTGTLEQRGVSVATALLRWNT